MPKERQEDDEQASDYDRKVAYARKYYNTSNPAIPELLKQDDTGDAEGVLRHCLMDTVFFAPTTICQEIMMSTFHNHRSGASTLRPAIWLRARPVPPGRVRNSKPFCM